MSDTVISLRHISKKYRLRHGWYVTSLRDEIARLGARLIGRRRPRDEFWALKDVSFEIKQGDVLGFIGVNGAGKSTLLKILSRVTVPTSGSMEVRGRVGALIEIGAGFHPELSGRENIFLNGAIMGMRHKEIQSKFDRIVEFAELERFIDTPIKFYSSGMQMRLGFAVAAHTDPDILLVDEILAVGDASFQAKCLNKIAELKEQAKTIILVSHALMNIKEHSKRVLWIDHGKIRMVGEPETVLNAYMEHVTHGMNVAEAAVGERRHGAQAARIIDVTTCDEKEQPRSHFEMGEAMSIDIAYSLATPLPGAVFGVSIQDIQGYPLGGVATHPDSIKLTQPVGRGVVRLTLRPLLFTKGTYTLTVHLSDPALDKQYDLKRRAATIVVNGAGSAVSSSLGHIYYPHQWEQLHDHTNP
jgi:ABC-type polysaccharide/polyol phosphate transport system ATPase subunit